MAVKIVQAPAKGKGSALAETACTLGVVEGGLETNHPYPCLYQCHPLESAPPPPFSQAQKSIAPVHSWSPFILTRKPAVGR